MFIKYNPNPKCDRVGDCTVRAISKLLEQDWDRTYIDLCVQGYAMKDMPSSNSVWGEYLINRNYTRKVIQNTCPDCYTIKDFCNEHKQGAFLLCTGTHVVTVIDGDYYDTWDSGDEVPIFYYERS